jgi:hypothetical protein
LRNCHHEGVLQLGQVGENPAGQLAHLLLAEKGHGHFDQMTEERLAQIGKPELADRVEEQRLEKGHDRLDEEDGGHEQRGPQGVPVRLAVDQHAGQQRKEKPQQRRGDEHEKTDPQLPAIGPQIRVERKHLPQRLARDFDLGRRVR